MDDELEMCREALDEIMSICSSYKGMKPRDEAPPPGEPPAVEVEIEAGPVDDVASLAEDEPEIISLAERPADREQQKRGRGRPRTRGY